MAAQLFHDLVAMHAQEIVFWSEVDTKYQFIKDRYPIIQTDAEVADYFSTVSRSFILCIGNHEHRRAMAARFTALGGVLTTYISPYCTVSPYETTVGTGATILSHVIIEPCVTIGEGCLLNKTSNVGHGCIIEPYCEIAPGVILTGEVEVGENAFIGTGAIVLPKVKIGRNAVIAAGTVVRKDVPDNALVSGVPGNILKTYSADQ